MQRYLFAQQIYHKYVFKFQKYASISTVCKDNGHVSEDVILYIMICDNI